VTESKLDVTSDVGRDLLQSAEVFKTEKHVVWEYVSNGLQYVDPGIAPDVRVAVNISPQKRIVITDNGRGMNLDDLRNYFVMHGVNQDRRAGRAGRGRFGTGKSAAFGIADCLTVTTVRNGLETKVRLRRSDIEAMDQGGRVPVEVLRDQEPTTEKNGTTVEISEIRKKSLDIGAIIGFIEGHIAHWPQASVMVGHHRCEIPMPAISKEFRYSSAGTRWEIAIGTVELVVKVAMAPLVDELQGIRVLSRGVWHESTLAGLERKDYANLICGEIDVAKLEDDTSSPSPFDLSRSMRLNTANETVAAIHGFIGARVDEVLREASQADRERRRTEEAKRLQKEADKIATIINSDFHDFRDKLKRAHAKGVGGADMHSGVSAGKGDLEILVPGQDLPGEAADALGPWREGDGTVEQGPTNDGGESLKPNDAEPPRAKRHTARETERAPSGGFSVQFENIGVSEKRAVYRERTIYVNLDHPQVAAARGLGGTDDPVFRRLAYEVAFTEYAVALASLMANEDQYLDTLEPIRDVRETIDRVTRAAAGLYRE
jgi:hypothetical protein